MTNSKNELPLDKNFGYFFSVLFALTSIYSYWQDLKSFAVTIATISLLFVAVTFLSPKILRPLNRVWYELGVLLGKVISPIVLGVMFFVLITPIAVIARIFGRDELKIKKLFVQSYWVDRLPPAPRSDSFKNQF